MARQVTKKAIRINPVLVGLGRAIEIRVYCADPCVIKWSTKDKVQLYSSVNGRKLFCIKTDPKSVTKEQLTTELEKKRVSVSRAVDLYSDWTDFDSANGCLISPPKGTFYKLGRCEAILYASNKWTGRTKHFVHDFKTYPIVWVNHKTAPTVVCLSGGKIRVKKEGITG